MSQLTKYESSKTIHTIFGPRQLSRQFLYGIYDINFSHTLSFTTYIQKQTDNDKISSNVNKHYQEMGNTNKQQYMYLTRYRTSANIFHNSRKTKVDPRLKYPKADILYSNSGKGYESLIYILCQTREYGKNIPSAWMNLEIIALEEIW